MFVVDVDEGADIGLKLQGRAMYATLQLLAGQFREPPFDLVQPGRRGWREVDVPVWPPRQPGLDASSLVGGVVVHDDVDAESVRDVSVDHLEEIEELPGAVAAVAFADHGARGDVEGGEQ